LDDGGFIMVVLLIGMAVSAIWLASALPSWRQQATREKEAELIFRGEQYARAIHLYQCKNGTYPPSIDVLVSQRYLREKYKDPITNDDFVPVGGLVSTGQGQASQVGVTAVRSKSTDASIKLYNGQQSYSQFAFETTVNGRMGACGGQNGGIQNGGRGGPAGPPGPGTGGGIGGRGRGGDETAPIVPRRGARGGDSGTGAPPRGAGPGNGPGNGSFGGGFQRSPGQ
jgi:type II secretory pathway pseudopilin PulG